MLKTIVTAFSTLVAASCASNAPIADVDDYARRAERAGPPKFDLVCDASCRLVYRTVDAPSIPLEKCRNGVRPCLWYDDFINLYVPDTRQHSWSYQGRDYVREFRDEYYAVAERENGELKKTYFVFDDSVWMVAHDNEHGWIGDDDRGILHTISHMGSILFVIYL